jgi:predicted ArsR family transcriptional regulator
MDVAGLGRRFTETTRGQIVVLLRRSPRTVEELAQALGLTDNAIRNHLGALQRDGLVRQEGVRRGGGAGKPAVLYELRPEAAPLLSRAYPPVLAAVMEQLVAQLPADQSEAVLREAGRRLARSVGGQAPGDPDARVRAAAGVLVALGGDVDVTAIEGGREIRGAGCPLSAVVSQRPELCLAVESMLAEVAGAPVRMRCRHGPRPSCCFDVSTAA